MWNSSYLEDDEAWVRCRDIVHTSADAKTAGVADDIEITVTVSGAAPESDADSDQWTERLTHLADLGASHFVMELGHPLRVDPVLRFVEQVVAPMRGY